MMVPFDGSSAAAPQQQPHSGVSHPPLPRPPMPPGHQSAPSPVMHHQQMNPPYPHPGMHRQQPVGMPGQQFAMQPQSPSTRQGSFSSHQQFSSSHPPLHSPAQHSQQMHGMPHHSQQMQQHRSSSSGRMGMGMQHDGTRSSSSGRSQQQYGMNGNWQSENDTPHRREMIQHIVKMLQKDKSGSPEWRDRLPQMAKQLEVSLYRNARSFEAYMDMSTLKARLQRIAVEVSRKARTPSDKRDDRHRSDRQQSSYNGMHPPDQSGASSPFMGGSNAAHSMSSSRPMVNMDDPMAGGGSSNGDMHHSSSSGGAGFDRNHRSTPTSGSAVNRNDPEWKVRIRHKQQRLLLLHHSAKCPHEDGRCTVTPHCADMKRLWRHMEGCKDNNCRVSHCFSSRAILSHYRKCKDPSCPACGPVRETVRKTQRSSSSSRGNSMLPSSGGASGSGSSGMMNPMMPNQRATPTQQHGMMSSSVDPMGSPPMGSFNSSTSSSSNFPPQQQASRQSSHSSSMPPPISGPSSSSGMQYSMSSSSHYRPPSNGPSSNSVQPLYHSDQPMSNPRVSSSAPQRSSSQQDSSSMRMPSSSGSGSSSRRNESEWQKIRHKQQRLLLLRHASRCQYEAGKCPVTPHCASMKRLWEHIAHCKVQQCTVQHCMSSRYVLSHYRRCKDARCPACGPVRNTIRESHIKERSGGSGGNGPAQSSGTSFDVEPMPPSGSMSSRMPEQLSSSANQDPPSFPPSMGSDIMPPSDSYSHERKRLKKEHVPSMTNNDGPNLALPPVEPTIEPKKASEPVASADVPKSDAMSAGAGSQVAAKKPSKEASSNWSLLNSFTVKDLETHLESLNRSAQLPPAKLKAKCMEVLKGLQTHQHGWVFNCPVDPVELGLPDYFDIIKKPMDLGTIHKKLDGGLYHAIEDFKADCNLTFDNAMTYNEKGSVVYGMAKELKTKFDADYKKLLIQLDSEDQERRQNDRACTLCGSVKLLFEPPVFFCNGMNCQSKRIRRNSHFYVGGNNQYFWCNQCYNELDGSVPIELIDATIKKEELKKKKNDEVHEESWVQCDSCQKWVHQICGLFNTRQNKEHHSEYCCPKCLLERRTKSTASPTPKPPGASDLPRTKLSEYLEDRVVKRIAGKKRELAEEKAQVEKISLEDATKAMEGGPVIIRQVTSMDRKLEVRDRMKSRYANKNYPDEFPFRCKCIVVFQKLDGVDVVLFALYVYEHGADNPPPNSRVVYISYLDSVHFMRPRKLRTFVYHEILIAYLDYARNRGFSSAHIWACPPLKGDDYIFYAKPEDQKTPRDSRLRQWYIDMLTDCQKRNIVGKVTNMYDLYFSDESLDATAVPYLEGDYFPGEAENIIKDLEEGGGKKGSSSGKKNKKKQTKSKGRGGTRSTGVDEVSTDASGGKDDGQGRDQVMVKLGETIQPMKDSFIVAFLNWSGAKPENLEVPEAITKYREENPCRDDVPEVSGSKRDSDGNVLDPNGDVAEKGPVKVINDDDEDLDCEFLNNRQAFLNLCRGNHYQFDELRRAKHTSMMVLWHLHNRDAPKFVQQCVACSREILSGKRYHCAQCPDYDLCQECYKNPKANRGSCTHKLQAISVESEGSQEGQSNGSGLTAAQRQQRQRNLMLHIQLIEHASRCTSSQCSSSNCAKMKNFLQHARVCKIKLNGGCRICKRIWALLRIHAQKCKDPVCPIPQCTAIREKMRQLQKQQQAMDDRRRLEMNRHYRLSMSGAG